MPIYYRVSINISEYNPAKEEAIEVAAREHWEFNNWGYWGDVMSADGEGDMWFSEEEFSEKVTKAIWKANGAFCRVQVATTCLEDLPTESYLFDEDIYQEFLNDNQEAAASVQDTVLPPPPFLPINDHTCPHCGENKVSLAEKAQGIPCWHCGNSL